MSTRLKHFTVCGLILMTCVCLHGQRTVDPDKYTTWIHQHGTEPVEGYLRMASLDSLILSQELLESTQTGFRVFNVPDVTSVRFRRKTAQGWGALIGIVAGATAGALIGAGIEGGDFCGGKCGGTQPGTLILLSGIGGAMIGASVGVAIGSRKKKIQLNGRLTDRQLQRILPYINR